MRHALFIACLCLPACAAAQGTLTPADEAAAFEVAGFARVEGQWRGCDDPGTAGYAPGAIDQVADLNGDGLPEAFISEGSTYCYGAAGVGYKLVSKQAGGAWKLIAGGAGMPTALEAKGVDGWPDLEIGGPGFCFPVERWNGSEYELDRHQYEGQVCDPGD